MSELDQADELDQANELAPMPVTLEQMTPWPFTDGPLEWPLRFELQPATETGSQPAGLHLCCGHCGQSMTRLGEWGHTLASLKPQISAHVLQVHADLIGC